MRVLRAVIAVALVATAAACGSGTPGEARAPARTAVAATLDPATARACADAAAVTREATDRFTAALSAAVMAGERRDPAAQRAAMNDLRSAFADWSAGLRGGAAQAPDPRLAAVLAEYAGAVDATVARVETPADLDRLYTFTEKELDIAASRFAEVCPA